MRRITVRDVQASRLPQAVGLCADDTPGVCAIINSVLERLTYAREVGDSGWIGGWVELSFTPSQTDPFVVLPRGVSRIINALTVCTFPYPVHGPFFEFLNYGFGRLPKSSCATDRCTPIAAYDRGYFPTFSDVVPPDKKIRIYVGDEADAGKRVLLQSLDNNSQVRYSLDGLVQVTGDFIDLVAPSVDSPAVVSKVTGIQKDVTIAPVSFFEVDTVTGDERLILTMEPSEQSAAYKRYYLAGLPTGCCGTGEPGEVQLTALCKLDVVPVSVLTDWVPIPNLEALTHEAQSVRFDSMDSPNAAQLALNHHRKAIGLLQGQSVVEQGKTNPSIIFAPFGTASLECQRIGSLI